MTDEFPLDEFVFGRDNSKARQEFNKGLDEIERRHVNYFEQRQGKPWQDRDNLRNHCHFNYDGKQITFINLPGSDLDPEIWQECLRLFNSIFQKFKKQY